MKYSKCKRVDGPRWVGIMHLGKGASTELLPGDVWSYPFMLPTPPLLFSTWFITGKRNSLKKKMYSVWLLSFLDSGNSMTFFPKGPYLQLSPRSISAPFLITSFFTFIFRYWIFDEAAKVSNEIQIPRMCADKSQLSSQCLFIYGRRRRLIHGLASGQPVFLIWIGNYKGLWI